MAALQPWRPAVHSPEGRDRSGRVRYTHYTFKQLEEVSNELANGFSQIGISRGDRVALMVPPSLDFFALTFALFKLGAVPVLIDPGIGIKYLGQGLDEAQPSAFIGIPKAHAARVLLGWAKRSIQTKVCVGAFPFPGTCSLQDVRSRAAGNVHFKPICPAPAETAAILFTSGSTGPSKGVVYTHEFFGGQVDLIRSLYRIEPGEIDLPTFPLFALFGPALGMTAILPQMDPTRPAHVDPIKIIEAIESFGVTNMFGSPALILRVGRFGEAHKVQLPTLRRVISAGAPVHAKVLRRFTAMLRPETQVFTPYGATECLPVSSIGSHEILAGTARQTDLGAGVCVGKPVPGIDVRIIRISDEPIPEWTDSLELAPGQIGEITVRGPHVTRSYFNRAEATALAKIAHRTSGGFYHRMGDVGYFDAQGRVWFCGRKSHRVQTGSSVLFTIPCEGVFNAHPAVFRTALVGARTPEGVQPVLCVELEKEHPPTDPTVLRRELLALGAAHLHTAPIQTILFHPAFPVDIRHNAKIFREKLAVWASSQLR